MAMIRRKFCIVCLVSVHLSNACSVPGRVLSGSCSAGDETVLITCRHSSYDLAEERNKKSLTMVTGVMVTDCQKMNTSR